MADLQIRCIKKTNRTDPHERIHAVGGLNPDGTRWQITQSQAIKYIVDRVHTFYTLVHGVRADVHVAYHLGNPYIKTVADRYHPDNLLALPECP